MPESEPAHTVTRLLAASREGDPEAAEALLRLLYEELRGIAGRHMAGERPDHTLQPTALVHEAYLRLSAGPSLPFQDRAHFLRAASRTMRRVLVDHARARNAAKRDGGLKVTLDESLAPDESAVDFLALEEALERLGRTEPRWAEVVELRFFGGLEVAEVARALGISPATAKRDWQFARAWLGRELRAGGEEGPA